MKSLLYRSTVLFLVAITATSCFDKYKPNYQYFPDMYEPVSYETYGEYDVFVDEQEAKLPAEGSIARGWRPFEYENTNEGYALAKEFLDNPLPYTEGNLAAGKQLYTIYCAVCHGDQGDGQGILVQREKILGIPSYDDAGRDITEGSVYYVMYYGLNAMGSYASQTTIAERWLIDMYVMKLKNDLQGLPEREFEVDGSGTIETLIPAVNADTTATESPQTPADDADTTATERLQTPKQNETN